MELFLSLRTVAATIEGPVRAQNQQQAQYQDLTFRSAEFPARHADFKPRPAPLWRN